MMNNQDDLERKTQHNLEESGIVPSGEEVLEQLGLDSSIITAMKGAIKKSYYRTVKTYPTKNHQ